MRQVRKRPVVSVAQGGVTLNCFGCGAKGVTPDHFKACPPVVKAIKRGNAINLVPLKAWKK